MKASDLVKCIQTLNRPLTIHKIEASRHGCIIIGSMSYDSSRTRYEFRQPGVLHSQRELGIP